ncbi:MAG TPA: hypothetical protein VNM66_05490 [Thermodesulfobacteriota bacterium]|nr:hypothetical protein [Thermodesulfobacteriota bacterium]
MGYRLPLVVDRALVDQLLARLREGLAQALPLKPKPTKSRVRLCPHCEREVAAELSKCPYCRRLFRL